MQSQKRPKKCNNIQKKFWSRGPGSTSGTKGPRSRGPGRTGPRDLEGPVVLAGQDLETLKVPGLENWKSPGTMESLICTQKISEFDDFTWSKELSDQLNFLKQNVSHKKPKVSRH